MAAADNYTEGRTLELTANSLTVEFSVPAASHYFDGHFPEFHLLPAVAQIDIVVNLARRYLARDLKITGSRRVKFSDMIRPGMPLRAELTLKGNSLRFAIKSADGGSAYSGGALLVEQ
jgi:3-hydroxymyristoyl/3-hydroxydecanoyl-(acyl carrier protein) dehydratase